MNDTGFFLYLFLMVGMTYLIRAVPFALLTKKITNVYIKSFLYYIPYAVLAAMTIPAIFYATDHVYSALVGLSVAVVAALFERSLTTVAGLACLAVYLVEWLFSYM